MWQVRTSPALPLVTVIAGLLVLPALLAAPLVGAAPLPPAPALVTLALVVAALVVLEARFGGLPADDFFVGSANEGATDFGIVASRRKRRLAPSARAYCAQNSGRRSVSRGKGGRRGLCKYCMGFEACICGATVWK